MSSSGLTDGLPDGFVSMPTTPGELLDRACILGIKAERRPHDPDVRALLDAVTAAAVGLDTSGASRHVSDLRAVNESLWEAEDRLRALMATNGGGGGGPVDELAEVAVRIARLNDQRGSLKRSLDAMLGARASEPKVYS